VDLFEGDKGEIYSFKIQTDGDSRTVILGCTDGKKEFRIPRYVWDTLNAKYYHLYNLGSNPINNSAGHDTVLYRRWKRIMTVPIKGGAAATVKTKRMKKR